MGVFALRRAERIRRKKKKVVPVTKSKKKTLNNEGSFKVAKAKSAGGFYDLHYKLLLIIPILMLVLAIAIIGFQVYKTGDFIHRGVSLKGGLTITAETTSLTPEQVLDVLKPQFHGVDIEARSLEEAGRQVAIIISADITPDQKDLVNKFYLAVQKATNTSKEDLSVQTIGSSLGSAFFKQTIKALFIAFLFMGFVVFLYFAEENKSKLISSIITLFAGFFMYSSSSLLNFIALLLAVVLVIIYVKKSIPSVAVMLAAFSDIIVTLAVVDLMGIKISTAGIAAFLMLIGYSVDTDILLSTRVLKRSSGSVYDGIISALKTGLTMNLTTLAAVIVALIFAESEVLTQIMTIIFIGLLADLINTWLQNAGILRWHLESLEKKKGVKA